MKSPLPKLAKDLAALIGIARKETSPAVIEGALADARGQVEAAVAEREAAEASYRDSLLDASPAESERQLAAASAAKVKVDRAEALVAALTQRLCTAREAEAYAERKAIHRDAVEKCEGIKARLPAEYQLHAAALRSLLRDLAEADVARERATKEAPDFPAILPPETELRLLNGLPEEIVNKEMVELWVIDGRTDPVPEDRQGDVRRFGEHHDRGTLSLPGNDHHSAPTSGVALTCTLRKFTRTRYREAVADRGRDLLCRTVGLPGFAFNDMAFVTADPFRDHAGALVELASDLPPTAHLDRPIRERLELLPAVPRTEAEVVQLRGAA